MSFTGHHAQPKTGTTPAPPRAPCTDRRPPQQRAPERYKTTSPLPNPGVAWTFISGFVAWHNRHHQHSGFGDRTPANRQYGFAHNIALKCSHA